MNIWQRFKNWLIVKMGGCTKKDYDDVADKADFEHDTPKEAVNFWRKNACYWHDKYNAEHENYLVMLSLYNTTVEQKQNNAQSVSGAIDTIKAYCKSKGSCDECALYSKNSGCKIHEIPCYWGNE